MAHGMYEIAGFEQIASLSSSTALPFTSISGDCIGVRVQAETQNVRMRTDGSAPTSSVGEIVYSGDPPTQYFGDLSKLRFIEATASAKLNVTYLRGIRPDYQPPMS
jgi:hypothetical protein